MYRNVVKFWRTKGYKIVKMYLDNGIGVAESFDQASIVSANVQADLCSLEFLVTAYNVNGNQFKKSFG